MRWRGWVLVHRVVGVLLLWQAATDCGLGEWCGEGVAEEEEDGGGGTAPLQARSSGGAILARGPEKSEEVGVT